MLDHVFISVTDVDRSIRFYEAALAPLGIRHVIDYAGADGPEGHPDLKGFGGNGRVFFWLRQGQGQADARATHIGFVAKSREEVDAFHAAAMEAGASDNGKPEARLYYDPRYYAANVLDPDGYSLEAVYKSWQQAQPWFLRTCRRPAGAGQALPRQTGFRRTGEHLRLTSSICRRHEMSDNSFIFCRSATSERKQSHANRGHSQDVE